MIPQFTLSMPVLGNSWAVGLAFQTHLAIVAFVMGIAVLAPAAELVGLRSTNQWWDRLARELASTITKLFSFGATWAVLALVLLYGLYPRLFGILTSIFFWPLVGVGCLWFIMTVSAYLYSNSWDRLNNRRGLHLAIGWGFAISAFLFISTITQLSSYQLTPTDPTSLLQAILNPSWPTELVHRHVGNLSYGGLILAGYAGARRLYFRLAEDDIAYFDWLGHVALLIGVGLALLQPVVGWFYAHQIQIASPGAYQRMMIGENSWMFLVQILFFALLLLLSNLYLVTAAGRGDTGGRGHRWMRISLWLLVILLILGAIPSGWPLGQMRPWKYISLGGLMLLSAANLLIYWRARPSFVWGRTGNFSQVALVLVGVATMVLIISMGIIRTSARGGDPIYNRLGPGQSQQIQPRRGGREQ